MLWRMHRDVSGRISLVVTLMVVIGALGSGLINFFLMMQGLQPVPRIYVLPDPIGWALTPRMDPLLLGAMLLAVVLLGAFVWIFTRLVARGAAPGRGAGVFFGVWGVVIVGAWIGSIARTPLQIISYRLPADMVENYLPQAYQISVAGALWALNWGWVAALVAALVHRAAGRPAAVPAPGGAPYGGTSTPHPQPMLSSPSQPFPPAPPFPPAQPPTAG